MDEREKLLKTVKDILVGPNPLPGFTQDNGEEILFFDSPLKTYVAGILFPASKIANDLEEEGSSADELSDVSDYNAAEVHEIAGSNDNTLTDIKDFQRKGNYVAESMIDEETSKINSYHQSAMSITVAVPINFSEICVDVSAGTYFIGEKCQPEEKRNADGKVTIVLSDKPRKCYLRCQHNVHARMPASSLPDPDKRRIEYELFDDHGNILNGLVINVTFRLEDRDKIIYTITLLNKLSSSNEHQPDVSSCWFQVGFNVSCNEKFCPLPDNFWAGSIDYDYRLNSLLYRDVKTYAIGHGCAATWDDGGVPSIICASVMPEYEVKPIEAGSSKASLSMVTYYKDREKTFEDLTLLCDEYKDWIEK